MNILHLIDTLDGPPSPVRLALLADYLAAEHRHQHAVLAIGPADLLTAARQVGLRVDMHQPEAPGLSWRTIPARWRLRRRAATLPQADVVHCWSRSGGVLGSAIVSAAKSRGREIALISTWSGRSADTADHRNMRTGASLLIGEQIMPAVDAGRIHQQDRRAIRMRWGVTDEQTGVVAVLGDPAEAIDAMGAMLAVGLAREAGRELRVLLSGRAAGVHRARHVTRAAGRPELVITDDLAERPWEVLPGCDLAIVMTGPQSLAWVMASGVPLLCPGVRELTPLIVAGAGAVTEPGSIGLLARRICELIDAPEERRAMSEAARIEAERSMDMSVFAAAMHEAYDAVSRGERPAREGGGSAAAGVGRESARRLA